MKKITNVEVKMISLNANDVIATSAQMALSLDDYNGAVGVGARGYYEDEEEEIW